MPKAKAKRRASFDGFADAYSRSAAPSSRAAVAAEVGFRGESSYGGLVLALRVLLLALNVGMILLNAYFLYYAYRLKDQPGQSCLCSLGWRRTFIEASLLLFVVAGIVGLVVDWEAHFLWLSAMYYGIVIAYLVVTRDFIRQMERTDCMCAETRAFQVLNVVNMVGLVVLGAALVGLVALLIFFGLRKMR